MARETAPFFFFFFLIFSVKYKALIETRKDAANLLSLAAGGEKRTGNKAIKEFSELLSTDRMKFPKKKTMRLGMKREGALDVKLLKKLREATSVVVDGKNYTRSFMHGNLAAEAYLRDNLWAFVKGVRAVLMAMLPTIYGAKRYRGQENVMRELRTMCSSPDGLAQGDFAGKDGTPLKINKAFWGALGQFFNDEDFARKVCRIAITDYLAEKELGKKVHMDAERILRK